MLNRVELIGNIGQDAEIRATQSGTNVVTFTVATKESWKNKAGEKQEETEWHRCVMFGENGAAIHKYLTKGKMIYVDGRIKTRSFEADGQKRFVTEIMVTSVKFLSSAPERNDQAPRQGYHYSTQQPSKNQQPPPRSREEKSPEFHDVPF